MANRLPFIGIVVAVILFLVYSSLFVVNERQQAIVHRFGEIVDVRTEPGVYFRRRSPSSRLTTYNSSRTTPARC